MWKKNIAKLLVFAMLLTMLPIAALATTEQGVATGSDGARAAASGYSYTVTLDTTNLSLDLTTNTSKTLKATTTPVGESVTWSSSDETVATVANGEVTAKKAGTATITATMTGHTDVKATCTVTVTAAPVAVTGVTLSQTSLTVQTGKTAQLTETVAPENATNKNVNWTSSNEAYATVSDTGLVTGVKAGTATITVTTVDGGKKAECAVTVTDEEVKIEAVTLNKTTLELEVDASEQLTATVTPEGVDQSVTWESDKPEIAAVDEEGNVTAKAVGTAIITATSTADPTKTAKCTVTVKAKPSTEVKVEKVTVEPDVHSMVTGEVKELKVTVLPENATDKTVKWESSTPEVATVDQDGKVTAVKAGKATITATAGGVSGTCEVTVSDVEVEKPAVDVAEKPDESAVSSVTSAEAKKTVEEAHEALKTGTEVTGLDNAIVAEKNDKGDVTIAGQTIDKAQIDKAMDAFKEQHSNVDENDIRTVVVPKVEIKIARASEASDGNVTSLTFDIKAFAEIWITAESESKNIDSENSVRTTDRINLEKTEEAITIVLPMPAAFQTLKTPFVKHKKGNDLFWHRGSLNAGKLSFVNKRGFSEFTVEDAGDGKAVIGENSYYNSLQDAIDAAKNNDVITVLDNGQSATVSKAITFKVVNAEEVTGATINAGSGYKKSEKDGTYTFTAESTSDKPSGGTGGGGGGGSSKPAIKPGDQNKPTTPTTTPGGGVAGFNDVATSAWYADSVKYVVDKGLFGGVGNGNFAPNANMTRAMMWTVLARYMGVNTNTGSNWYEAARTWAMAQNISDGTMADGNVTREQFVTMLWRLSGEPAVETSASFTDNGSISGYAKTAVDWAVAQGILNGYNDGSFRPQGSATRAEVAKMLTVFCQNADNAEPTESETESEA